MEESRFASIDWASKGHAVRVLDAEGGIIEGRRYSRDEHGIRALCARLIASHPSQVAAMRPRFTVAGGKNDSFDAFVLAAFARTDSHRFRVLVPDRDQTKALRAFSRAREDLVGQRVALANAPRAQLESFRPGATHGFAEVDSPIALAFLERYPPPADARALGEQRMARFLARQHTALGTLETEALRQIVLALIVAPVPIVTRIGELTSDCRQRDPTTVTLAADGGQAPVAIEPGTSTRARFRCARDHRPRAAICTLADTDRHHNPCSADIDNRARARGCTHRHAIRIPARACCGLIWRPWQDADVYHPARHTARQRLTTTTA